MRSTERRTQPDGRSFAPHQARSNRRLCARSAISRWHGRQQAGQPKANAVQFLFHARFDRRHDRSVFSRDARQSKPACRSNGRSTVAHEWSHLAGYADESEANFVGWLVCMRGPAPVQYSGWLSLYGTVMNALPRSEREELARRLDKGLAPICSPSPIASAGRRIRWRAAPVMRSTIAF